MSLVGLDLNATRARAVIGPAGVPPKDLPLEDTRRELPAVLSLQNRHPEAGRAGLALCRQLPHLVCENFFSRLGTPHEWSAGRHRINAARALGIYLERIRAQSGAGKGVALAVPPYLTRQQGEILAAAVVKSRLPYLGSVPATIALALSAFKASPWTGPAIVVDLDDHALTCSVAASSPGSSSTLSINEDPLPASFTLVHINSTPLPRLGLTAWKMRLIDGVSDRCIRHSRRDPRDSGAAEQMLFDQLDEVFDACRQEQMVEIVVQGAQWCQNLILRPEDVRGFCGTLVQHAIEQFRSVVGSAEAEGAQCVLVSASAWRLPGLREALQEELAEQMVLIHLEADAAALGAHDLAAHFQAGNLPREHLDAVVRCPLAEAEPKAPPKKKRRLFGF
jgi:hypothetical protein